ncbi:MAG: EamA family transporter [Acidobacteriota bacterium]|nr:EamA family transporter [Acidobacteriota bacterium]
MLKTRLFTLIVILTNVLGDSSLRVGLREVGSLVSASPVAYVLALLNPWVAMGVSLLILWMLSHMALLSWADLSYVLPVTSVGYALVALAGKIFLHESVSFTRWTGIAFIVSGVLLVGRTEFNTTRRQARPE